MANGLHDVTLAQCTYLIDKCRFFGLVAGYQLKLYKFVVVKRPLELELNIFGQPLLCNCDYGLKLMTNCAEALFVGVVERHNRP